MTTKKTTTTHEEETESATHVKVASAPDGVFTGAAGHALASIRLASTHIPGATYLSAKELRALTSRYCIDPRFLEATCTAVEASPELARLTGLDTVKVRNAIRMDAAFAPVEQEARSLSDAIHGARVTNYCAAVDDADAVMKAARGLMSTSAKKELADHVPRMSAARLQKRKTSARPPSKKKSATSSSGASEPATTGDAAATTDTGADASAAKKTTTVTTMTT